ncbi:MAG TPA: Clp protease N-terminal domain-containing protein, partial [Acidimicrobiales bacterium]|nr:Clp protease N-terminal domain-containing protein [Acidimicrobiales bacterium]
MDLSLLVLVAARVRGVTADVVLRELDVEAAQRCLNFALEEETGSPRRRACALLWSIVRERPFSHDNDLIALIVAAQVMEETGDPITFEPNARLGKLLEAVRTGEASIDDVVDFVAVESDRDEEEEGEMFERFTPRARGAISEAKRVAGELQHNFIGTEHLLLGVLAVEEGIGGKVLHELGVTTDEVRRQIVEMIGPGPKAVVHHFPFTPRSKKVLELALRNSLRLGHDYIGTEHILLGLAEVKDGVAGQIFKQTGVTRAVVEERVLVSLAAAGWSPPTKKARRRLRQRPFPGFVFEPYGSAADARNQRLRNEIAGVITENDLLREEVGRLRR